MDVQILHAYNKHFSLSVHINNYSFSKNHFLAICPCTVTHAHAHGYLLVLLLYKVFAQHQKFFCLAWCNQMISYFSSFLLVALVLTAGEHMEQHNKEKVILIHCHISVLFTKTINFHHFEHLGRNRKVH